MYWDQSIQTQRYLCRIWLPSPFYDESELSYQWALAIREKVLGPEHLDTASPLSNLGVLYQSQAKCDEVEPLYVQVLGPENPSTASTLNSQAEFYKSQGKYIQRGGATLSTAAGNPREGVGTRAPEHSIISE
ncbi:hypothetical protein BC936DRAFT_141082 [Jimgerdemannia flammicorona]|uniref:Uncharacterized protein n=1 Tax=Jimgerdemannia flammicorona TaxID=994334 RepID=A0A433DGB0_9FUNG|nr:hypothetical protein BC936DRAFT_141082 [Jimgerdemannia flammicorona]